MASEESNIFFRSGRPSVALRARLGALPDAERRVADVLLGHPDEVLHASVGRLAGRAATSPATVVRLSRRLGFDGYAALKIAMAQEAGRANQFGHRQPAGSGPLHAQVMAADARSILGGAQALDPVSFEAAVDAVERADEVLFVGVGASAALASLASFRFTALGLRASSLSESITQHLRAATLGPGSVCVAISHTGESRDTIDAAVAAHRAGATTLGFTSFAGSPLAEATDVVLVCAAEDDPAAHELFANPVVLVSALGALHAAVAQRRPAAAADSIAAAQRVAAHQY